QEMWMFSLMEKPASMSIRSFYSRVEQIFSYRQYYPRPIVVNDDGSKEYGEHSPPPTDRQMCVLLMRAVPTE
ncbi:MAG: hypothetical protein ACREOZ_00525, partial [Gloeomargaritales cyanobacterium]